MEEKKVNEILNTALTHLEMINRDHQYKVNNIMNSGDIDAELEPREYFDAQY